MSTDSDIQEGKLEYQPTPALTYMVDGAGLKLPIAKRARDYKSVHWLNNNARPPRGRQRVIAP